MLYSIVKRCMIHGPCGISKRSAPCMHNDSCFKKFPKVFSNSTTSTKDGTHCIEVEKTHILVVAGTKLDDRWVVPYNSYLS